MTHLQERLKFLEGYQQCLLDLHKHLMTTAQVGTKDEHDNISAMQLLEHFIMQKCDLNQRETEQINLMIPKAN